MFATTASTPLSTSAGAILLIAGAFAFVRAGFRPLLKLPIGCRA